MISWLAAISSIFIVSYFAYWNRDKKEQYNEIFRQSEKWLRGITMFVLFYLAIHLASKAFWGIGIPKLGQSYDPYFLSPQDIFLFSLVFFTIMSLFLIAPYIIDKYKNIVRNLLIISFVLSILITLCIPFNSITEPSLMDPSSKGDWHLFTITFVVSLMLYPLIRKVKEIPKGIKGDFRDLWLIFCFLPAIIVASLVLAGDELVKFPNVFGNIVVGLVLISGFATLMSMVTISFKQGAVKPLHNPILLRSTLASLAAISGFSTFFLLLRHFFKIDIAIFGKALSFSVAIMIVILLYGFLYEKLQKYQFTEWWRRESKPIAMIVSILLIAIVAAIDPKDTPIKLVFIFVVLFIGLSLPWIPMVLRRFNKLTIKKLTIKAIQELYRDLLKILREVITKTMHQGMVLVKADPGSLQKVVKGLDGMEGVYQTMVVRGEYEVCLIIEGLDYYEIEKKISEIRKIDGVADTTTLRDISEFFDREVR
jgi:hypothetical protein